MLGNHGRRPLKIVPGPKRIAKKYFRSVRPVDMTKLYANFNNKMVSRYTQHTEDFNRVHPAEYFLSKELSKE